MPTDVAPQPLEAGPDSGASAGAAIYISPGGPDYLRVRVALFLAGFATFSLLYGVQPLLPLFARHFSISPASSALSLSLPSALLAVALLVAAALSESAGRRGLMFASMIVASILNLAAAASPNWGAMLAVRAAEGFVLGGVPAVAMAYLAEEIDPRGLGAAMGLYVGGTALGGLMGRLGCGVLAEAFSWRIALAGLGLTGIAAALGFWVLLPPSRNFTPRRGAGLGYHLQAWAAHLRHPALPLLFAVGFLIMGAFVAVYNYTGFRLIAPPYGLNQTQLGLIFVAYLFGIAASSVAGSLADRMGRGPVLILGLVIAMAGVGLTLLHALAGIIGGIVVMTIGFFMAHSVASGWVGRLAASAKGHASSLYLLAYYLGSSIAGAVGGWFWSHDGWRGVAIFAMGLLTLGLGAALGAQARARQGA